MHEYNGQNGAATARRPLSQVRDFNNTGQAGDGQGPPRTGLARYLHGPDDSRAGPASPHARPLTRTAKSDFAVGFSPGPRPAEDAELAAVDPAVAAEKQKRLQQAKDDLLRQEQAALSLPLDRMEKHRFSLNEHKYVPVDMRNEEQGSIMKLSRHLKCSIVKSSLQDQTDFFIFRSKHVVFEVNTRSKDKKSKLNWTVKRYESDFYLLRSILVQQYGQVFVPPLTPIAKESVYHQKTLLWRERWFSRFLRGVVRSHELLNHPLVIEFLKIDHHGIDSKVGMKDFTKKLQTHEQSLQKLTTFYSKQRMANHIYRVTSYKERILVARDLEGQEMLDEKIEKSKRKRFDEKQYVLRYEQKVGALLALLPRFQQQIDELKDSYTMMLGSLSHLSQIYQDDQEMLIMLRVYANTAKMFSAQSVLLNEGLNHQSALLKEHFLQQQHVVNQTLKPYLPKIPLAEQRHKELLQGFLKKRQQAKESFKESSGLAALERELKKARLVTSQARARSPEQARAAQELPLARSQSVLEPAARPSTTTNAARPPFEEAVSDLAAVKAKYQSALYNLLLDVETRFLSKERKELDLAESSLIFTRNQFLRELKRTMNEDEGRTLKYQMIKIAEAFTDILNRLNIEWSDYKETRLQDILDDYYKQQIEWEEKEKKVLASIEAKKVKKKKQQQILEEKAKSAAKDQAEGASPQVSGEAAGEAQGANEGARDDSKGSFEDLGAAQSPARPPD